jgi:hypothetical protein
MRSPDPLKPAKAGTQMTVRRRHTIWAPAFTGVSGERGASDA